MRLTDCFIELVAYVAYFLDTIDRVQQPFEQVKSDIQALISKSQRLMEEGSFSKEDYDLARFAIFAWIDEAILSSNWSDKHRWQAEQLQRPEMIEVDGVGQGDAVALVVGIDGHV